MLTWLCTFLSISGCTESTEQKENNSIVLPLFSIQDVRAPFLTQEDCLQGSVLQAAKTENAERFFCSNNQGILVGPSIERQLAIQNDNFKYTWYTDGKLSHVPLIYKSNGLLDFDTTEKLLLQSRQVSWFKEWIDYRPKFLEDPQATLFALQNQLISLETALEHPLNKMSCTTELPQNMTCYPSNIFMLEPNKNIRSSQRQWQIHATTTFYSDIKTVSSSYLDNCSEQCNCESNHDEMGQVSWKTAQDICQEQGKRLPTFAELLQIHKQTPTSTSEWIGTQMENKEGSLIIYDWREIEKTSTKTVSYPIFTSPSTIEEYKPEQKKRANFRCVSDHIQKRYFGSEWVEIAKIPLPKMNTMRGYGEAWYRQDAGYRETVLNWDEFGKGYIEDRASVKDTYMLAHAIHKLHQKYPKNIRVFQLAHSHFGHPIYALRISSEQKNERTNLGDILHLGAIHGNEVFTTNALLNAIEDLLSKTKYSTQLQNYNFWFVPMANPDGNWMAMRKAMAKSFGYKNGRNTEGSCQRRAFEGTDLSTNFPDLVSPYPEKMQLEPETEGLLQLFEQLQLVAVLSLHSGESNIFLPTSFKESSKNTARSGMSFFIHQLDKKLQQKDFNLPVKNLHDEEHEISYLFAKTGIPSLVIDYPNEVAIKSWEERSYIQKKYSDILDIYWSTLFTQQSISGFIKDKNNAPIHKSLLTIVELGEVQPITSSQNGGFFSMALPNLETVTLRVESEGYIPVEKKIAVKFGTQNINVSLVTVESNK